ncbi:MAG TPA: cation:proton antiporter [Xanthobacteraceae bacterium]|jgi:Kef-type K+ transport system membrane component KefB/nucleotide-binding universal stress UspA family protein
MMRFSHPHAVVRRAPHTSNGVLIPIVLIGTALAGSEGAAWAAQPGPGGASATTFFAQLILLMLVGRVLGELMIRLGQPSVMGMLIGGILLGPSGLGLLWPGVQQALFPQAPEQAAMLDGIAQLGVLLLLLLTGMETDLKFVRQVGKSALVISLSGVAVPFMCGFALGELMPETLLPRPDQRLITSLFLGTALSISSIKIVAAIIREMGFTRRKLGQIIIASAICEDSIGWCIIAMIFSLAQAHTVDLVSIGRTMLGTVAFLIASFTVGRRIVFLLMRWANDYFESDFPVVTTILVIMGTLALVTQFIGVHTVLGAFVAGVLVGESPILSKHVDEQLRGLILAFFMPVFFGVSGLSTDLSVLKDPTMAALAFGVVLLASFGKFAGAFIGGAVGGLTRQEALALGCGMNARGSTEIIVATIGLSMGALSHNLFTIIVAMAIVTTLAMPPMLRWALARVPISSSERERLEREEYEAREFLPTVERLLLAADESPNGNFAAHVTGLVAGSRSLTTTVLPLPNGELTHADRAIKADAGAETPQAKSPELVKSAARATSPLNEEAAPAHPVDVMVRMPEKPGEQGVEREAKKGYGLLILGIRNTKTPSGEFHQDVARIVAAFDGPAAIVDARNGQLQHPQQDPPHVLVPINGTEISRRGAELAIAVARASGCPVTVLHVANTGATTQRTWRGFYAGEQARAVIGDITEMGQRHGVRMATVVRTDLAPDAAILAQLRPADLLIMGVSRRPGKKLFFGDTAAAVFQHSPGSILLLAI